MATIRKRTHKWQVLIRRQGLSISRSFLIRKDAQAWARHMEAQADRGTLPPDAKALDRVTLGELVVRYRDTVTPYIGAKTSCARLICLNQRTRNFFTPITLMQIRATVTQQI